MDSGLWRVIDTYLRDGSDREVIMRYCGAASIEEMSQKSIQLLADGLVQRDADAIRAGLLIGHAFGFARESEDLLLKLLDESWHDGHEDAIFALDRFRDKRLIPRFMQSLDEVYDYDIDDGWARHRKAIFAISKIPGEASDRALKQLLENASPRVREEARERLRCRSESQAGGDARAD